MSERRRHGDRFSSTRQDDGAINYEELPTAQVALEDAPTPSGVVVNLQAAQRRALPAPGYDPLEHFTPVPERNTHEQRPVYTGPEHFARHDPPAPGELTAPIDTNTFLQQAQAAQRHTFSRLGRALETTPAYTPLAFAPATPTPAPPPPPPAPPAFTPGSLFPEVAEEPARPAPPPHRPIAPPRPPPRPAPPAPPQPPPHLTWGSEDTEGSAFEHTNTFEADSYEAAALKKSPFFLIVAGAVLILALGAALAFFFAG